MNDREHCSRDEDDREVENDGDRFRIKHLRNNHFVSRRRGSANPKSKIADDSSVIGLAEVRDATIGHRTEITPLQPRLYWRFQNS